MPKYNLHRLQRFLENITKIQQKSQNKHHDKLTISWIKIKIASSDKAT